MIRWLLFVLAVTPAWGYNLTQDFANGFYWAGLPVKFTILEKDPTRKALLDRLTASAVQEWETETDLSLWDLTSNGTNNVIRWSNNFAAETKMDPESVLAVAIRYTNGPYFAKSEIVINGGHSAFNSPYPAINNTNLATTLVHELGHTLGLDHSENMLAIMAPTLQYPYNGLHVDDLDGMKDVHAQTEKRQLTRYISPLAYSAGSEGKSPMSCGTTTPATTGGAGGLASLALGMLIGFIRKILGLIKSQLIKSLC